MSETMDRRSNGATTSTQRERAQRKRRAQAYRLEAEAIKALAHPKRLLILDLLSAQDERTVSDLQDMVGISQANLSQNLAVLRKAGLVATRRDGNLVHYRLADERIAKATQMLRSVAREARAADDHDAREARAGSKSAAAKRNALLGALLGSALLAGIAFAALHPLVNGGNWMDVETHVRVLLTSPDLGTLTQNCRDVATRSAPMPTMGPAPA